MLRPEMWEHLSQKSGKMQLDVEKTQSLAENIEMRLEKTTISRGY
ncbi:hypothetical protein QUA81_00790 [Microcoleus sp. F6_B4]